MRAYAKQVREAIKTKLKNELNTKLQALDTEYKVWPMNKIQTFSDGALSKMLPECVVIVGGGQIVSQPTLNINEMAVLYTATIEITIKNLGERVPHVLDSYEQAILEVLHGANIGTYCHFLSVERGRFVDQTAGGIFDGTAMTFQIRVN